MSTIPVAIPTLASEDGASMESYSDVEHEEWQSRTVPSNTRHLELPRRLSDASCLGRSLPDAGIRGRSGTWTGGPHSGNRTDGGLKMVIVMVGLPARGKSFISHKLANYLKWGGSSVKIFNVGEHRRQMLDGRQDADFFNKDEKNRKTREKLAASVLETMLDWLKAGGSVAIFDATNSNAERREKILVSCTERLGQCVTVVFIESVCTDETVLEANILQKITSSPDYRLMDPKDARDDLVRRLAFYEAQYQTIENDDLTFIKLFNLQSKVHCNRVYGRVALSLVPYLMSVHIGHRPIWLTRSGCIAATLDASETVTPSGTRSLFMDPAAATDLGLNEEGVNYARSLKKFLHNQCIHFGFNAEDMRVFSSTLPRTVATARILSNKRDCSQYAVLNCLEKGVCQGWTVDRMGSEMPDFLALMQKDPVTTRFPGGESYGDAIIKIRPFLLELEQNVNPVCVVSHLSTIQVLLCYFMRIDIRDVMSLDVPRNTVVQAVPKGAGWDVTAFTLSEHGMVPSVFPAKLSQGRSHRE